MVFCTSTCPPCKGPDNPDIRDDWVVWLGRGVSDAYACLGLMRLVRIGDYQFPHLDVHRRNWFLLDQAIAMPRQDPLTGVSLELRSIVELHLLLWRGPRSGLRKWQEMITRGIRLRTSGFPRDIARFPRNSGDSNQAPFTSILGNVGAPTTWGPVASEGGNHRNDGPGNLTWGGDGDIIWQLISLYLGNKS